MTKARPPLSNAERCRLRREKLRQDPERWAKEKEEARLRSQKYRQAQKPPEVQERQAALARERQRRYDEKQREKKAAASASQPAKPSRPKTRQDNEKEEKKREANREAVKKHRQNWSAQKRRRVNEHRMKYYYKNKAEKEAAQKRRTEKGVQAELSFTESGCPYPTQEAFKRAVRRFKERFPVKNGTKLAHLLRGTMKSSSQKTKQELKKINVTFATPEKSSPAEVLRQHVKSLSGKRDKVTLGHKRSLADAFEQCSEDLGFSKRFCKGKCSSKGLYDRTEKKFQPAITDFFLTNSVSDPCKKSKKRQLLKPITELYRDFRTGHPSATVSLRTFFRHKPKNVASVTKAKFRQCLCELCLNPKLKLDRLHTVFGNGRKCEGVRDLLDESVCEFATVPKLACVERKCSECGTQAVRERMKSELGAERLSKRVTWSRWESVKYGKSTRVEKVRKEGSVDDCLQELFQELDPLFMHTFVADWQRDQLKSLKADLPDGWAIATCDFAENFLCKFQDEPQSAHWGYKQVTVFPVVCFYRCPSCRELRRDSLVFLSDDLCHDSHFAQACIQRVLGHLQKSLSLEKVLLVSDGCAAQFKSKLPFMYLSHTQVQGADVEIEKVFFGSRHGKNDSDWCGGAVKRAVTQAIGAGSVTVSNAQDMFSFCRENLAVTRTDECQHKMQKFFLLEEQHIDRKVTSSMVGGIPGSRKLHHLRALGPGVLATRQLSCFCTFCKAGDFADCQSEHVSQWETVKLKYTGPATLQFTQPDGAERECQEESDFNSDSISSDCESDFEGEASDKVSEEDRVVTDVEDLPGDADVEDLPGDADVEDLPGDADVEDVPGDADVEDMTGDDHSAASNQDRGERLAFFASVDAELAACSNFEEVQNVCRIFENQMKEFSLPVPEPCNLLGRDIDVHSQGLLQPGVQRRCFPVSVSGDGNCFFNSLSVLLFGNEQHHQEMRVRIIVAMAVDPVLFIDGRNWCYEFDQVTPEQVMQVVEQTSVAIGSSLLESFQNEVMGILGNSTYAGLWEFFAASHILKRPVQSVYPLLGNEAYQIHCNRIIRAPGCQHEGKVYVMWTGPSANSDSENGRNWLPNHFVPVVVRRQQTSVLGKNSLHLLTLADGKEYIGQVEETDDLLEMACVRLMWQKPRSSMFFWPSQADFSWEPFTSFKREVVLDFVPEASSHRCQLFRVRM